MASIDPSATVAELVIQRPARARVFESFGLDYCCGGKRNLEDACARRGLDVDTVIGVLEAEDAAAPAEGEDWSKAPLGKLCDHIVEVHHERLRVELPRLSTLLEKVERAHGIERPELAETRELFEGLRVELEAHMAEEEQFVFPTCRRLEAGEPAGLESAELAALEDDHAEAGAALERLRELTGGYDLGNALCNTHRATLDALHALELELHQHIHEENNILFSRALELVAAR